MHFSFAFSSKVRQKPSFGPSAPPTSPHSECEVKAEMDETCRVHKHASLITVAHRTHTIYAHNASGVIVVALCGRNSLKLGAILTFFVNSKMHDTPRTEED